MVTASGSSSSKTTAGNNSAETEQYSEEPSEKLQFETILPWGGLLTFWVPSVEEAYWRSEATGLLLTVDWIVQVNGALHGLLLLLRRQSGTPLFVSGLVLPVWIVLCFLQAYSSYNRLNFYVARRTQVVVAVRLLYIVLASIIFSYVELPDKTVAGLVVRLLFSSNVATMWFLALGLRVKFKTHLPLQIIVCGIAMCFNPVYCRTYSVDNKFGEVFSSCVHMVEYVFSWLFSLQQRPGVGTTSSTEWDCWMLASFLQLVVGVVLPSAVLYCVEICSRTKYALSNRDLKWVNTTSTLKVVANAIVIWIWILFIGSSIVWMILRALAGFDFEGLRC